MRRLKGVLQRVKGGCSRDVDRSGLGGGMDEAYRTYIYVESKPRSTG